MTETETMPPREAWPTDLTDEVIVEAAERAMLTLDNPGFCLECGHENGDCEQDMRHGRCEACGHPMVFGAELLLFVVAA